MTERMPARQSATTPADWHQSSARDRFAAALPRPLTSFIGRQREVEQVCALLRRDGVRLVTLTGPGGVGKTRLAIAVSNALAAEFRDGAAFVGLAPVRDADLVPSAIAQMLGIVESATASAQDTLISVLSDSELLLILDNFEHLLDAAPRIAQLVAACSGLTVLATSRASLRVSGEREHPVPPLDLPPADDVAKHHIAETPAIRLYVERAEAVDPGFHLTDDNAAAVAAICTRLDGLPLAIELAAARSKVLSPALLLPRLARQLPLLTGGPRDAPARLQTMHEAIAWSYDLLDAAEQRLFQRLSVFVGGFTLPAAEAIADLQEADSHELLAGITTLVDHNLVRREAANEGESRFGMLEPIREFALDRLAASSEESAIRDRHAAFFEALVADAEPQIIGPHQGEWLPRLQAELPNLRATLAWLHAQHRFEEGFEVIGRLWQFWYRRCHFSEGRRHLATFLDRHHTNEATPARARAMVAGAELANWQMDLDAAVGLGQEALRLWEEIGDPSGIGRALNALGSIALDQGDLPRTREFLDSAALHCCAAADGWGQTWSVEVLGVAAYAEGNYAEAAALFDDALTRSRELGDLAMMSEVLGDAAHVALVRGDLTTAARSYDEALTLDMELQASWGVAWCLSGFAGIAAQVDQPVAAAQIYGANEALHGHFGAPMRPSVNQQFDLLLAPARTALGEAEWQAARIAENQLSLNDAVREARRIAELALQSSAPYAAAGLHRNDLYSLSPREQDVLRLLVAGQTDREIAATLFISRKTASNHVSRILDKLEVENRAAAVAKALGEHLI